MKKVLITGGVSGIGLAIATAFARAGDHLYLGGQMAQADAQDIMDRLRAEGAASACFDDADLSDGQEARAMAARAIEKMGGISVLVNNAGIQHVAPVEEFPADRWQAVLDINLSAPFHLTASCLQEMRQAGFGRIINIASVHGLVASTHKAAYVAAKHGLIGLTKTIALETADTDITCNAVCPGWVRTPLVEAQIEARAQAEGRSVEETAHRLVSEKQPTGKFMTPEQIADMVLYLADEKAANITGSAFSLDGGWTAC